MATINNNIFSCLESLIGQRITIEYDDSKTQGILISISNNGYYIETLLQINKAKRKFAIYYPFFVKNFKGVISFDYRIKKLNHILDTELVYNLIEDECHPFLNKIVLIYAS